MISTIITSPKKTIVFKVDF